MKHFDFTMSTARRMARHIVDLGDKRRKEILMNFDSDLRCMIVEEVAKIKKERFRNESV